LKHTDYPKISEGNGVSGHGPLISSFGRYIGTEGLLWASK
jgi:hypothetical protein